ncbi:MAG: 30S ribosomal protein S3 [Gammaproteobacteria bacterium]|nr:30S ribosomal protein S3 [Gammaproteobacteria bacterium]
MGQKVHPTGMRLGIVKDHTSIWYASGPAYAEKLHVDLEVRDYIQERLSQASVSRIEIQRPAQTARITIHTARPGIVIGKKGEDVERLRQKLSKMMGVPVHINIEEVRKPELDAYLVAQNVALQLERRVQFRRAMKRVMQNATRLGAEGIKVRVAGRLGGAEIARSETYHEGRVPLHTLRADIDYATAEAMTTYGILGVKVWIFKGEILGQREESSQQQGANVQSFG